MTANFEGKMEEDEGQGNQKGPKKKGGKEKQKKKKKRFGRGRAPSARQAWEWVKLGLSIWGVQAIGRKGRWSVAGSESMEKRIEELRNPKVPKEESRKFFQKMIAVGREVKRRMAEEEARKKHPRMLTNVR